MKTHHETTIKLRLTLPHGLSAPLRPVCVTILLQMLAELEVAGTMTGSETWQFFGWGKS